MESFGTIASFTDENPMRPSEDWMDPPRYIQCLTSRTEGGTQVVLGPSADPEARLPESHHHPSRKVEVMCSVLAALRSEVEHGSRLPEERNTPRR